MSKYLLTIEKSKDGKVWGRVEYQNDLLVDSAKSVGALERKFKKLLYDFHDVDANKVRFDLAYDLTSLFEKNKFLNISAIAEIAGINTSLMRQYAAGLKYPSADKANQIEEIIRGLGKELMSVRIGTPKSRLAARTKNKVRQKA